MNIGPIIGLHVPTKSGTKGKMLQNQKVSCKFCNDQFAQKRGLQNT